MDTREEQSKRQRLPAIKPGEQIEDYTARYKRMVNESPKTTQTMVLNTIVRDLKAVVNYIELVQQVKKPR